MVAQKALLLRVGIDKGYGALSPIFDDLSFVYLPIYYRDRKEKEKKETRTYETLGLMEGLPRGLWQKKVHFDPEFDTFTYGDPTGVKRKSLLRLVPGDILAFYLGGRMQTSSEEGCFLFGFLEVERVVDWNSLPHAHRESTRQELRNNAHFRSSKSKHNLVVVKGSQRSRLLEHCIPLTDRNRRATNPPYLTKPELQRYLGIREFIVRSTPIWIVDENKIKNLVSLLEP